MPLEKKVSWILFGLSAILLIGVQTIGRLLPSVWYTPGILFSVLFIVITLFIASAASISYKLVYDRNYRNKFIKIASMIVIFSSLLLFIAFFISNL